MKRTIFRSASIHYGCRPYRLLSKAHTQYSVQLICRRNAIRCHNIQKPRSVKYCQQSVLWSSPGNLRASAGLRKLHYLLSSPNITFMVNTAYVKCVFQSTEWSKRLCAPDEQSPQNWWVEYGHQRIYSECGPCCNEHGLACQCLETEGVHFEHLVCNLVGGGGH
jgi:hypothetical protein